MQDYHGHGSTVQHVLTIAAPPTRLERQRELAEHVDGTADALRAAATVDDLTHVMRRLGFAVEALAPLLRAANHAQAIVEVDALRHRLARLTRKLGGAR